MNFIEKFRTKPRNRPPPASARRKLPRSTGRFIMLHESQVPALFQLNSAACWALFTILLRESFRHGDKTFILPINKLAAEKTLSRANLRRALRQLEANGLISVWKRPPKPPLIRIL
jgi:hypothetical protein